MSLTHEQAMSILTVKVSQAVRLSSMSPELQEIVRPAHVMKALLNNLCSAVATHLLIITNTSAEHFDREVFHGLVEHVNLKVGEILDNYNREATPELVTAWANEGHNHRQALRSLGDN